MSSNRGFEKWCQSHRDLNRGLRPVGAGPDLDTKKPVSTGSDLISIAGIPVVAVAGSHRNGWTVLRTCDLSKNADPGGGLIQGIREDPEEELLRS